MENNQWRESIPHRTKLHAKMCGLLKCYLVTTGICVNFIHKNIDVLKRKRFTLSERINSDAKIKSSFSKIHSVYISVWYVQNEIQNI